MNNGFLTTEEVASILRVSLSTLYSWLRCGKLKGQKIGDLWRIRREDLETFLKPNKAG